ncbi:MAG: hypothetical protein LC798_11135 [Chloroflexi bacterium]|nr:hypothetical protein [Chloroflexota bacterium]
MAVIFHDDFTRATDADLTAHVPTIAGTGWTQESQIGTTIVWRVLAANDYADGSGGASSGTGVSVSAQPNPAVAEYDIEAVYLATATATTGLPRNWDLIARWTDQSNFYTFRVDAPAAATDKRLRKMVAGTLTELASNTTDAVANDAIKFEIRDATKKVYVNGVEELSSTDNALTGAGKVGMAYGTWATGLSGRIDPGWDIDDFKVTEVGGGTSHPLAAAVSASAAVSADLQTGVQFATAVTGTATTAVNLQTGVTFEAAVTGTATATGELFLPLALFETSVSATATVSAEFSPGANLSAAATGTATVAGALSIGVNFSAAVSGEVTVSADLTAIAGHQAQLVFRLYPRTNPKNGAMLVEFSQLKSAEFRREANGTGAGRIVLAGDSDDAAFIDPRGMQYIRVYALMQDASEVLLGGFFLETGDYDALTARGTNDLSFGGGGTLSYLGRAVMWSESFLTVAGYVSDPVDDLWRLSEADGGTALGTVFWILIRELQEAARPQAPIPAVMIDFDQSSDSDSTAWSQLAGEMTARVKDNVLTGPIKQLMERGLYVDMDGDFGLHAYEPGTYGRDLTGVAWASDVVRFQTPTDGTMQTGNIKADARRAISASAKRSVVLVGADDVYEAVEDVAADLVWEGAYDSEAKQSSALQAIGAAQLAARADADDVVQIRIRHGDNPAAGSYMPTPGGHLWLNDTVTLHTGTGDWDWNESEQRVAAISWKLGVAGDWDVFVEFGSVLHPAAVRVQVARDRSVDNITHLTRRVAALQAAGANLLEDSSFEASTAAAWAVGTGWTRAYASAAPYRGIKTARLLRSNASAGVLRTADFIPVSRLDLYNVSTWSFLTSIGANVEAEFYIEEYNSASTLLATTVIAELTVAQTAWTRHSAKFGPTAALGRTAWQATTTKVKVGFRTAGTDTTPTITWEVDGVQLERGNLMTAYAPMPEELYNVPGEVIVDENGVTIVNGALTVKNPGGTVIIDGTSDHFRIVATGTISCTGPNGATAAWVRTITAVTVNTGLSYPPMVMTHMEMSASVVFQLPYTAFANDPVASYGTTIEDMRHRVGVITGTQTNIQIWWTAWLDQSAITRSVRYYILEQTTL